MREQELIQMRNRLQVHSKMIEAIALQQKQLEQYIGVTMEVVKRMDGYEAAELQLQKDLNDSKKNPKDSKDEGK